MVAVQSAAMSLEPELHPENSVPQATRTQQRLHPRRTSPMNSLSLPQHKRRKLGHSNDDPEVPVDALSAANAPLHQETTGDSGGSDQSASKWFDSVNQHIPQDGRGAGAYDDDPPFFISNQTKYVPPNFPLSDSGKLFGNASRLDSENEDLRGVIDDLTVENKKLKQILRMHRSHRNTPSSEGSHPDKLFEVRMHGLPAEKRRELEFLLKNFATSMNHVIQPSLTNSTSNSGLSSNSHGGKNSRPSQADSGYVSNSTSGQTHLRPSSLGLPASSKSSRDRGSRSLRHEIPDTLMPRKTPIMMSDRAKMALVVRRLEQLFTGKTAAPGEHSQPLQQQELSHLAARADAKNGRKRKSEGNREAHILPPDTKVNLDAMDVTVSDKRTGSAPRTAEPEEGLAASISRPTSPDQRPTRPLDLDIHRAQVAAENIQYIRHLGLSSPHLESMIGAGSNGGDKEASWMYLNLLVNMAQLHTINVTPDFVRRAIKKLSNKFELSKDGHRVRWIGGPDGTVFSKEEEQALEGVDRESSQDSTEDTGASGVVEGGSSSKRSKTDSTSNAVVSNTASDDKTSGLQTSRASKQQISTGATSNLPSSDQAKSKAQTQTGSSFDYKPIVYRERQHRESDDPLDDTDSSLGSSSRDSSGLVQALSRSNLHQRNADEGLITFYNNPYFCSDYSGDKMPRNLTADRAAAPGKVLGLPAVDSEVESPLRYGDSCYFTPQFGPGPVHFRDRDSLPNLVIEDITRAGEEESQPLELEACGLGGVTPDDNFAVDVKVCMRRTIRHQSRPAIQKTVPFTGHGLPAAFTYHRVAARKIELLPSTLPPPSYVFFTSSTSSGNAGLADSESESSETSSSTDEEHPGPAPPAFPLRWSGDSFDDDADLDGDEEEDDSSVDMLALARAADPEQIAEQERQYMITQPGGARGGVAGSLAATVGASRSSRSNAAAHSGTDDDGSDDSDDDDDQDDDDMEVDG